MVRKLVIVLSIVAAVGIAMGLMAQGTPTNAPAATAARVRAAERFLASLDAKQTALAAYPFGDAKKATWNNLPPNMNSRAGIPFRDLTPAQQALGYEVVRSVLSTYGYDKVQSIMAADDYFGQVRGAGGFPTGPSAYMLAIFGTPSTTQPWAVQFNGHHLGVNVAVVSPTDVLAPTLTAAYPNMYERDGQFVFVLGDEANRALKLTQALTPAQLEKAVQKAQIWDFVLGPGHDNEVIQPEGLRGSEMTAPQRDLLLDVASAWINIVDDVSARAKMDELRRNIADTYWLWSGDAAQAGHAYFRIQGPTVLIEYAPQTLGGPGSIPALTNIGQRGARGGAPAVVPQAPAAQAQAAPGAQGDAGRGGRGRGAAPAANDPNRRLDPTHVHTVYRDFTNDYGKRFIAAVR